MPESGGVLGLLRNKRLMTDQENTQSNIPVSMIRDNLEDILKFDLPVGYKFLWYRKGDEKHWTRIQKASDNLNNITDDLFYEEFGDNYQLLNQRQCFTFHKGQVVGTATAWFNENYKGKPYGRLHWVAIIPSKQGLGLSKPLMTVVCERLRMLGHNRAYLTTDSARIPAINLYLKFGFRPEINSQEDLDVWLKIQENLRYHLNLF
jgi:GNAT superfamily N-acetyltransferase